MSITYGLEQTKYLMDSKISNQSDGQKWIGLTEWSDGQTVEQLMDGLKKMMDQKMKIEQFTGKGQEHQYTVRQIAVGKAVVAEETGSINSRNS